MWSAEERSKPFARTPRPPFGLPKHVSIHSLKPRTDPPLQIKAVSGIRRTHSASALQRTSGREVAFLQSKVVQNAILAKRTQLFIDYSIGWIPSSPLDSGQ
jgi:hypothetical protein